MQSQTHANEHNNLLGPIMTHDRQDFVMEYSEKISDQLDYMSM